MKVLDSVACGIGVDVAAGESEWSGAADFAAADRASRSARARRDRSRDERGATYSGNGLSHTRRTDCRIKSRPSSFHVRTFPST